MLHHVLRGREETVRSKEVMWWCFLYKKSIPAACSRKHKLILMLISGSEWGFM